MLTKIFKITLMLFVCGCSQRDQQYELIKSVMSKYTNMQESEPQWTLLIVPVTACGICVDKSISFIKNNYKNKHLKVLLMSNSKKELRMLIDENILKSKNIIHDYKNLSLEQNLVSQSHPKVYIIRNERVIHSEDITYPAAVNTFEKILKFIQ